MTKKTQKKMRKALLLLACAAMLVCITIGATVAYLTSTATVTNTFTVGSVGITMVESEVDEYGVKAPNSTATTNGNEYKMVSNHTYTKDPTITVTAGSENTLLFVKVVNPLGELETTESAKTIASQMTAKGWTCIDATNKIWVYGTATEATPVAAGNSVVVFDTFTLSDKVTNTTADPGDIVTHQARDCRSREEEGRFQGC